MSTPNDRRVIYSTYIVPTKTLEMDETYVTQEVFMDSPGKTLGGRGKMTIGTQWGDGFTSMNTNWEDADENWQVQGQTFSNELAISDTATDLNDEDSQLDFLYIKNTGQTNEMLVSLNGTSGNYYIEVPPEGSVYLRGAHADLDCNDVFVKCNGSETTTIEYIVSNTE
jgi:hypothetical protein